MLLARSVSKPTLKYYLERAPTSGALGSESGPALGCF